MTKKTHKKRIILLDSHAIIHRAYHALPDFANSSGKPTGALYGLSTMIMALIKDFKPDHIIAAFDLPKPTYRHEAYADYKSGRRELDDNLVQQLKSAREIFKAFQIPIYEKEGFEADDIIGTAVAQLKDNKDWEVIIASGDMDTLQLVSGDKVKVFTLRKGIKDTVIYDEKAVKDRFGFPPKNLIDYKGLRGDASDNIIGIPGIGEKTATTLICEIGDIEKIYKEVEKISKKLKGEEVTKSDLEKTIFGKLKITPRVFNLLAENEEEAMFSKMLATIRTDAPVKIELPKKDWHETISAKPIRELFTELEFRSLIPRVNDFLGKDQDENEIVTDGIDEIEIAETAVALWLIDSSITNPTLQDILQFAKTDDFKKAQNIIFDEIKKRNLIEVFEKIEKPLVPIIREMKEVGVKIDTGILKELSKEYHKILNGLEKDIWKMADIEFNINSPKQMAEILFDKMELKYKGMRKTSSGSYSTKEEVLQKLVEVHPIAEKILDYRELQKLLSTYIDNFPKMIAKDGRVHTTFLQAGSTTGRMASTDPALQNIPIRSEYGRRIRNAFIAEKGNKLVALDYSQIELRLAAILSGDKKMIDIFKSGKDVHTEVAAQVFSVEEDKVTKDMRRKAKVINFGILYGMGVSALQKNLKTDRKEAQKFYDDYFKTFKTLASYLDEVKAETARKGYTETMFGRRRYFEGIKSSLPFIRAQAERMAINAPIQGTEGDLVKLAMVEVDEYLNKKGLKKDVKLLMQIHDEVVYEVKTELIEKVSKEIEKIMEGVLSSKDTKGVPILVDASFGPSWGEMKSL